MQRLEVAGFHIRGLVKGLDALELDVDALLRKRQRIGSSFEAAMN